MKAKVITLFVLAAAISSTLALSELPGQNANIALGEHCRRSYPIRLAAIRR